MANRTVSVALVADVGQYQSAMVRAAASTKTVGDSAVTAGTRARTGFDAASKGALLLAGVAGGALAIGLKGAVTAAADAEQSIGGAQAVFKGYADSVIASSERADRALGLSSNSYRELATIIGSQMKNAGVPLNELADKTEDIIGIGADLAAQFGGSTQQAVEALSSAFRGELDPIERYGISLTAAAVGAKAVEMGLAESATELSQNAKAMATLAIITEQSADAQGAFGREADTAAGRAQRAAASWENLKVEVGERLLPVWSSLVDILGTEVIPALGDFLEVGGDVLRFIGEHKEMAIALAAVLAIQLAGGVSAVTVAFNKMVLTPAVLGLNAILGTVLDLPGAFAAARTAVGGFIASVAPLAAAGAVVYGVIKLVETVDTLRSAGEGATVEIDRLRDSIADAGGGAAGVQAAASAIEQLRDRLAETRAILDRPAAGGDWFESLLGPAAAGAGMSARMADATESAERFRAEIDRLEEGQLRAARATSVLTKEFGLTAAEVTTLAQKYGIDLTGAVTESRRLFENFYSMEFGRTPTEAMMGLEDATEGAETAVKDAKDAVDAFKLSLDILTGAHVSMIAVESAFEAAVANAEGALKDMTGSVLNAAGGLNMQSEAGRAAADVLLDVRESGNQLIATMIQQGASADTVRAKDAQLRASFIATAREMGISEAAALDLADQILGIPAERETRIDADTKAAQDKIAGVQSSIDNLKGRTVEVQVRAAGRFIVNPSGGLQEFAEGGWTGPGARDDVAGVVHADEFVVPKHRVRALGGPNAVGALVGMPGYADGGPVLPIGLVHDTRSLEATMEQVANAMRDAAPAGLPGVPAGGGSLGSSFTSLFAAVKAAFPSAGLNSGYRPGDPGYHGRGKAADIGLSGVPGGNGNAFMARVNQWLYDYHRGSLAELIYDGLGDSRPDLKNSRDFAYSAATQAQHRNHVHAAVYDQGGPLYPGLTLAYNGTGKTEWVSKEFSGGGGGGMPQVNLSLEGATVTGRFEFGTDGMVTLVDGRINGRLEDLYRQKARR